MWEPLHQFSDINVTYRVTYREFSVALGLQLYGVLLLLPDLRYGFLNRPQNVSELWGPRFCGAYVGLHEHA